LGEGVVVDYPVPASAAVTAVMRGNRKRDTVPELAVRRALHARGRRYSVNRLIRLDEAKVRPDIVFPHAKVAVFIDGCFWHGCPMHGTRPHSNREYWDPKISRNKARDERNTTELESAGWRVVRAWEHDRVADVVKRIEKALER
jgi:DNA mismatch endonuclease (patch repair protein)